MVKFISRSVPILLALMWSANVVAGQAPDSTLAAVLSQASHEGRFVRITADSTFDGRITEVGVSVVRLVGSTVRVSDIQAVDFRVKRGGGAKIGAILGSLVVGIPVAAISTAFVDGNDAGLFAGGLLFGALVGGPIGGIVGAAVHPAQIEWQQVWTR